MVSRFPTLSGSIGTAPSSSEMTVKIVIRDDREDYGEDRFRALGFIDETLCAMVFTEREELVRVISLRRASRQERVSYDRQAE